MRPDLRGLFLKYGGNFSREDYEKEVDELAGKAGSRPARGNLLGKIGRILTPDEFDREREAFLRKVKKSD